MVLSVLAMADVVVSREERKENSDYLYSSLPWMDIRRKYVRLFWLLIWRNNSTFVKNMLKLVEISAAEGGVKPGSCVTCQSMVLWLLLHNRPSGGVAGVAIVAIWIFSKTNHEMVERNRKVL